MLLPLFNDLTYFMLFDSLSHPFVPCQCLLTIIVNITVPPFDQVLRKVVPKNAKCGSNNCYRYLSLL